MMEIYLFSYGNGIFWLRLISFNKKNMLIKSFITLSNINYMKIIQNEWIIHRHLIDWRAFKKIIIHLGLAELADGLSSKQKLAIGNWRYIYHSHKCHLANMTLLRQEKNQISNRKKEVKMNNIQLKQNLLIL